MTIPPGRLREKDFIREEPTKWKLPPWVWLFFLLLFGGLLTQFFLWMGQNKERPSSNQPPFYRVTNREMSLFLWQNPSFMKKANPDAKRYLPAFDTQDGVSLNEDLAEGLVVAPPEVLFRYHTWNRLLKGEFTNTPIPVDEFLKFLAYSKEWLPANWPNAPAEYTKLIPGLPQRKVSDLSTLSYTVLPLEVRIAFQGWSNYFLHSNEIEQLRPTKAQVTQLLLTHPNYARNYWRNIEPEYLSSLASTKDEIPQNEVPLFLKQALYNIH